jgi:hypothetical protein
LNVGLHSLRDVSDSPQQRIWATPLWFNLLFLVILAMPLGIATYTYLLAERQQEQPASLWSDLLKWTVVTFFVAAAGLIGLGVIHRGRLVLNRDECTLCFYYLLFLPRVGRRQLFLDDIVSVKVRTLTVDGMDESPSWTYRIVVAELRDGRLASIAFDSTPGIADAIRDAIGV